MLYRRIRTNIHLNVNKARIGENAQCTTSIIQINAWKESFKLTLFDLLKKH